jgi:hypothetical protein
MSYLIYSTETQALTRAEQEGQARNLQFYRTGDGSRYVSTPRQTKEGKWALDVSEYDLSAAEKSTKKASVIWPEPEEGNP